MTGYRQNENKAVNERICSGLHSLFHYRDLRNKVYSIDYFAPFTPKHVNAKPYILVILRRCDMLEKTGREVYNLSMMLPICFQNTHYRKHIVNVYYDRGGAK